MWLELDEAVFVSPVSIAPMTFFCPEPSYPDRVGFLPPNRAANYAAVRAGVPLLGAEVTR